MISFLRFIGAVNAAVWLGASVFMTFFAGPAFFSADMIEALKHRFYAGLAAQVILDRYFTLQCCCAIIALVHMLAGWFYLGRRAARFTIVLWACLTALIVFGGFFAQPKLHKLHQTMYYGSSATEQTVATKSFRAWHGASQAANLIVTLGVMVFFWRSTLPGPESPRYGSYGKYWG